MTKTDTRPHLVAALDTADDVIDAVRPDQLDAPTPCEDFRVEDLLEHLVGVLRRIAAIGRGDDPFAVSFDDIAAREGWATTWREAVDEVLAIWSDDAALSRPSPLPWAPGDGNAVLASYVLELTIHTWDLATGIGVQPRWDDQVLAVAMEGAANTGLPETDRHAVFAPFTASLPGEAGQPDPFQDAVDAPRNAPLIDRLVAWSGRSLRR